MATNLKKLILALLILFTISQNIEQVKAQNVANLDNTIINSKSKISLAFNDKPLSYAIQKLADKTNINFVLSQDFQDGNISVKFEKVSPDEILKNLMNIGNFTVEKDGNAYILKSNNLQPLVKTEVVKIKNLEAYKLAYVLTKENSNSLNTISYDDLSNSLILTGDNDFINTTITIINRLDVPKESFSVKLNNYNAKYVAQLLKSRFENNVQSENDGSSNSLYLTPYIDENMGYVIKGTVEKKELVDVQNELPTIINDDKTNQITIIGNSYQIQKAKDLIKYVDGENNKEITIKHAEIKQENITQNTPSNVISEVNKDNILSVALEKATLTIEKLNNEIKNLQASKMWKMIIGNTEGENNYNKQIAELMNKISSLKQDITQKETLLEEKNKYTVELEQKLTAKDKEIEELYKQLAETKAKLTEAILKKDLSSPDNIVSHGDLKLLATTQEELNGTKQQLQKVKNQLKESKRQLEMIYGGSLFDITNPPNSKSWWFK